MTKNIWKTLALTSGITFLHNSDFFPQCQIDVLLTQFSMPFSFADTTDLSDIDCKIVEAQTSDLMIY